MPKPAVQVRQTKLYITSMKIFTGKQIREWDSYTMEHEPIRPIDLMERAAVALTDAIVYRWDKSKSFVVFAGPGNNGGDALAVARLLAEQGYTVEVYLFNTAKKLTDECQRNMKRVMETKRIKKFVEVTLNFEPPQLNENTIVVDGLFGSGLNKPLSGGFAAVVKYINTSNATVVSIDMPSGLMTEDNTENIRQNIIRADLTLTLEQKKLAMYLADNEPYLGEIEVLDINLSEEFARRTLSQYYVLEHNDIKGIIRKRSPFAHKGTMGHALIFAGCYGMAGAAVLSSKACLRTGAGKVTVHTPLCNNDILQISVPEAIMQHDREDTFITETVETEDYECVAMGPGLGRNEETAIAVMTQIRHAQCPVVLDADALNMLADHRTWMGQLPRELILTPHPVEFDRLSGGTSNGSYDRLAKAHEMAQRLGAYIVLKGHYTMLCTPDGEIMINPTGNAGMATAGSGDVLTGIISGLLARGYTRRAACILGVYLHGLAGDKAAEKFGQESMVASDIIACLPDAFRELM